MAFRLTGGNATDAPQAAWLLATLPENVIVLADKAYDADAIRRLKDFRRIATRYDKRADTFMAALHINAIIAYWL